MITGVKITVGLITYTNTKTRETKTTTFSESSGRQVSQGTTLCRSYLFQNLSNLRFCFSSFGVCISYEAYGDFYASYHRSKSTHGWKSESVPIIMSRNKKKTRAQFWELRLEIESALKQPCWCDIDSISEPKTQNCGCVFFWWRFVSLEFFLQFSPNFDSQ